MRGMGAVVREGSCDRDEEASSKTSKRGGGQYPRQIEKSTRNKISSRDFRKRGRRGKHPLAMGWGEKKVCWEGGGGRGRGGGEK